MKNNLKEINLTEYKLIIMRRKTISIQVMPDLSILVKAPLRTKREITDEFVLRHRLWIMKTIESIQKRPSFDENIDIKQIKKDTLAYFSKLTEYYSQLMNLYPTSLKITNAKTRFGSCSSKNAICFSYRLMLYPEQAREYVVVHELAHIKYKNHGKEFYKLIESYLPDYKERKKLLR